MLQTTRTNHSFHWSSGGATRLILSKAKSTARPGLNWNASCKECYNLDYLCLNGNSIRQIEAVRKKTNDPTQNHTIVHLYRNHEKKKRRNKWGRKGNKMNTTGTVSSHHTDCCLMPEPTTAAPPPSQKHQPVRDKWEHNPVLPAVVGRYTLESRCDWAARDSRGAMGKNNKNSTRGVSSKKNICNQETSPIYQTFAADPHHFCITGNSQVSYELHLALPFLGLAQTGWKYAPCNHPLLRLTPCSHSDSNN